MTTLSYSKVDISNLSVGDLTDNKSGIQKTANIMYEGANLRMQTPELKLIAYGIPRFNKK